MDCSHSPAASPSKWPPLLRGTHAVTARSACADWPSLVSVQSATQAYPAECTCIQKHVGLSLGHFAMHWRAPWDPKNAAWNLWLCWTKAHTWMFFIDSFYDLLDICLAWRSGWQSPEQLHDLLIWQAAYRWKYVFMRSKSDLMLSHRAFTKRTSPWHSWACQQPVVWLPMLLASVDNEQTHTAGEIGCLPWLFATSAWGLLEGREVHRPGSDHAAGRPSSAWLHHAHWRWTYAWTAQSASHEWLCFFISWKLCVMPCCWVLLMKPNLIKALSEQMMTAQRLPW